MQLSAIGKMADHCWLEIHNHFPFMILAEFIVIPNHITDQYCYLQPCMSTHKGNLIKA
jgi:hypothetical protein